MIGAMLKNQEKTKQALFQAFREDHAVLGRGLYELRQAVDANNPSLAQAIAERIDQECGAHIAFEEYDFYPALDPFLSADEVTLMYESHDGGHALIESILNTLADRPFSSERQAALIDSIEKMEAHVSDCGELFGVMGGLSPAQQEGLLDRLEEWRRKAPRWTELRKHAPEPGL